MKRLFLYISIIIICWLGFKVDSLAAYNVIPDGISISVQEGSSTVLYRGVGMPIDVFEGFYTPYNNSYLYIVLPSDGSGSVQKSTNGGSTWSNVSYQNSSYNFSSPSVGRIRFEKHGWNGSSYFKGVTRVDTDSESSLFSNYSFLVSDGKPSFSVDNVKVQNYNPKFVNMFSQWFPSGSSWFGSLLGSTKITWRGFTNNEPYGRVEGRYFENGSLNYTYSDSVWPDVLGGAIRHGFLCWPDTNYLENAYVDLVPFNPDGDEGETYTVSLFSLPEPTLIDIDIDITDKAVVEVPHNGNNIQVPIRGIIKVGDDYYPQFDLTNISIDNDLIEIIINYPPSDTPDIYIIIPKDPDEPYPDDDISDLDETNSILKKIYNVLVRIRQKLFNLYDLVKKIGSGSDNSDIDPTDDLDVSNHFLGLVSNIAVILTSIGGLFIGFFTMLGFFPLWATTLCSSLMVLIVVISIIKFIRR